MTGNPVWLRRGFLSGLIIGLVGALHLFGGWERTAFDARTAFTMRWGAARTSVPVTIVAIDDAALDKGGRWPWSRSQLAQLIGRINRLSPTVLGVDLILAEPAPDDAALSAALAEIPVVLPVYGSGDAFVPPLARLAADAHLGHIEIYIDPDSVVRSVPTERAGYPPFGIQVARLYKTARAFPSQSADERNTDSTDPFSADGRYWLDLRPRSGNYVRTWTELVDTVSAADVLAGSVPEHLIVNRIVIIGVTAAGAVGLDQHVTPHRAWGAIPGVYLHAALAASEVLDRHMARPSVPFALAITLSAGVWGGLMAQAGRRRTVYLVLTILLYLTAAQWAHTYRALWLPVGAPLLTVSFLVGWAGAEERWVREKERRELRRLFGRYVPPQVMPEILRRSNELGLAGVQRDVVVLFADMRGFTALAEQLQPEQVFQVLNMYLAAMAGAVRQHGGMVDKYLGDGLMALFGAPIPHDHAVQAAVYCAMEMHARVSALQPPPLVPRLPLIGIGIHVGEAILGTVGGKERLEYTVMGDVVNVAARLEELAGPGTILLSGACTAQLQDPQLLRLCKPLGERNVRGKQRPIKVYEISCPTPGTS
ncbi:MAG TPA: adenylate/guanylate cyclase domain-containing protein [Firmicutes bacterium]|nr:adenylate/guanylate cyclase domain-containing protein [Bacillota bacterium]